LALGFKNIKALNAQAVSFRLLKLMEELWMWLVVDECVLPKEIIFYPDASVPDLILLIFCTNADV
jgi:hypothetical protein